ncbi:MAG: ABC transporter permease [Microgenomates group bacterium]|jgi:ABC-type polysaccharide/polyol phosphate export permease
MIIQKNKIFKYKDLFWQLTLRDIKAKYKQSYLGYSWVILVPLINLTVLSIVFTFVFKVPTGPVPYPVYLFTALVPWLFMSNAIVAATGSVLANSSLVTKIYLPREILPLSAIASKLVDLFLTAVILGLFMILFRVPFHTSILFVPIILFIQVMLITGISFILSASNVFYRDIEHAIGVILGVWMYLTPVVYSPDLIPPDLKIFFYLNPMSGIIDAYRATILYGVIPLWPAFLYSFLFSLIIFIVGYFYFRANAKYFAEVI